MVNLSLEAITKVFIAASYLLNGGNKSHAAKSLGISRTTFNKKFSDLNVADIVEDVAELHENKNSDESNFKEDPRSIALVVYLIESDRNAVITGMSCGGLSHIANEFLDMIYVAIGGLHRAGMSYDQIGELFEVLRRANVTRSSLRGGSSTARKTGSSNRGSLGRSVGERSVDFATVLRRMRDE